LIIILILYIYNIYNALFNPKLLPKISSEWVTSTEYVVHLGKREHEILTERERNQEWKTRIVYSTSEDPSARTYMTQICVSRSVKATKITILNRNASDIVVRPSQSARMHPTDPLPALPGESREILADGDYCDLLWHLRRTIEREINWSQTEWFLKKYFQFSIYYIFCSLFI